MNTRASSVEHLESKPGPTNSKHPLHDLAHLILDYPASEPLRRAMFGTTFSIFDLWSRPWGVVRLLGLRGVPPRPHPSKRVGEQHHKI